MALADIRHWRIGDVTVSRIVEVGQFADNIQMLFSDADADWLRQFTWLAPRFITPEGKMIISFQAFVVRTPGCDLDADTVREYVKENLARFKVPRDVVFVDELPRNATGKVVKRALQG